MKVIIDRNNPITIEDTEGRILFEYEPNRTKDTLEDLKLFQLLAGEVLINVHSREEFIPRSEIKSTKFRSNGE